MHKLLSEWWKVGLLMVFFAVGISAMPQETSTQDLSTQEEEETAPKKTPRPKPTAYEILPNKVKTPKPEPEEAPSDNSDVEISAPSDSSSLSTGSTSPSSSSSSSKNVPTSDNTKSTPLPSNSNDSSQSAPTSSNTSLQTSPWASPQTTPSPSNSSETLSQSNAPEKTGNQPISVFQRLPWWLIPAAVGAGILLIGGLVYSFRSKPNAQPGQETLSSQNPPAAPPPQVNFRLISHLLPSQAIEFNEPETNHNGSLTMNVDLALTMNHDSGSQTIATVSEMNGDNGSLDINMGLGLKINFDKGIQTFDSPASLLVNQ